MPDSDTPALLDGCPNPYTLPDHTRFSRGFVVLCGCPGVGDYRPRHWVVDATPFFCHCAPREVPELDPGTWMSGNPWGYACRSCANRLPSRWWLRLLVCDMPCCWCGGLAKGNHGFRISGHPAQMEEGVYR
jgi:hypothetical protein